MTEATFLAWQRVAQCEEGGNWHADVGAYSGGLGISSANWIAYGGSRFAARGADASPDEQIVIAERIQQVPPDQDGACRAW